MNPKRVGRSSEGNRKRRNCVAQKAYRQRQRFYVKELEEKLQSASRPDTEHVIELNDTIARYRQQLLEAYKKLESMRITLNTVLQNVAETLGMTQEPLACRCQGSASPINRKSLADSSPPPPSPPGISASRGSTSPGCTSEHEEEQVKSQSWRVDTVTHQYDASTDAFDHGFVTQNRDLNHAESEQTLLCFLQTDNALSPKIVGSGPIIDPSALNHEPVNGQSLQMGFPDLSLSPSSCLQPQFKNSHGMCDTGQGGFNTANALLAHTNSQFSDHISLFMRLLQNKITSEFPHGPDSISLLENCASHLITTFTSQYWPSLTSFMAYTNANAPVAKVTSWGVNPSPLTYFNLDLNYRPTDLQLSVPHPAVIDWVPFPVLRDQLIWYNSDSLNLDDIICEIADAYCCDVDLSKLVRKFPSPTWGFVRVRELINTIARDGGCSDKHNDRTSDRRLHTEASASSDDIQSYLPAESTEALFSCRSTALRAFRLMGMDKGLGAVRLDPEFFVKHPELYDPRMARCIAKGAALHPPAQVAAAPVPKPRAVDLTTIPTYQQIISWSLQM